MKKASTPVINPIALRTAKTLWCYWVKNSYEKTCLSLLVLLVACVTEFCIPTPFPYFIDYGDKDNLDLAERFSVSTKKDDYPTYLLFLQGKAEPIKYTGDYKSADQIKKFLMKESGLIFFIASS